MTQIISHVLVGFDPVTERVAFEMPAPATMVVRTPDDPDGVYCYPVAAEDALKAGATNPALDYFIEGYGG